jgi:hypothetical protein
LSKESTLAVDSHCYMANYLLSIYDKFYSYSNHVNMNENHD